MTGLALMHIHYGMELNLDEIIISLQVDALIKYINNISSILFGFIVTTSFSHSYLETPIAKS